MTQLEITPAYHRKIKTYLDKNWPDLEFKKGAIRKKGFLLLYSSANPFINTISFQKYERAGDTYWKCLLSFRDYKSHSKHVEVNDPSVEIAIKKCFKKALPPFKEQFDYLYKAMEKSLDTYKSLHNLTDLIEDKDGPEL